MNYTLRAATPQDTVSLAALAIQVWLDTYAFDGVSPAIARYVLDTYTAAHFEQVLAHPLRRVLVVEARGYLLGYLKLSMATPCPQAEGGSVELETLYLSRHFKRQGLGSALLQAADSLLPELGGAGMWLRVYHGNADALSFYAARGFTALGKTVFELDGEQHENIVLYRSLQPSRQDGS